MHPEPAPASSRRPSPSRSRGALAALAALGLLASLGGAGCGAAAISAAERGDLGALRREIDAELREGDLSAGDARSIAEAVASREVRQARGAEGLARVRGVQSCAREVEDALEEKAEAPGAEPEIAAAAAEVLFEAGLEDADDIRELALEGQKAAASLPGARGQVAASAWKALYARTLVGDSPEEARARRALSADGDEDVRLAALYAISDAADPADLEAALEAARVDPNPLARTVAVRAVGRIGGERVVLALKDIYQTADEDLRQAIVEAYAQPNTIAVGGRRELGVVVAEGRGAPAIAAAIALARVGGEGSGEAFGLLGRAVQSGPTKDRIYAIGAAPLEADYLRGAVVRAESDPDEAVALAAMSRRLSHAGLGGAPEGSPERARIVARLTEVAKGNTRQALAARGALARAGVTAIVPTLFRDVRSRDRGVREAAGTALVILGRSALAAPLLADENARIRASIACAILRETR